MADKNIQLMSENGVDNLFPVVKKYIDTSNLLATIPSGYNISYTATQDCYLFWTQINYTTGRELTLNGVALATDNINVVLPLQAGDVITCGYNGKTVKVFGVK